MFVTGVHAAQQEAALRGSRWLWHGVQGPSAIPAAFRDQSWHTPYSCIGLRMTGGNGADLRPGFKGYQQVPFDCTVVGVALMADRAGSILLDIYRSAYASFPPRASDTLIGLSAYRPALVSAQWAIDEALFGWQTTLTRGQVLGFDVLSATGINSVTLTLLVSPNHKP